MATVAWKFCLSLSKRVLNRRNCFEVREGSFNPVALFVKGLVEAPLHLAHASGRDYGLDFALGQMGEDGIGVVALVGDDGLGPEVAEQRDSLGAVVGLAAGQNEAERKAQGIGEQVNLVVRPPRLRPRAVS